MTNELRLKIYNDAIESYQNNDPFLSDSEFDKLRLELIEDGLVSDEDATVVEETGKHPKIEHAIRFGSLHSYHTHGDINDEDMKFALNYCNTEDESSVIQSNYKYDGLAFGAAYVYGKLKSIATRGDYFIGSDITEKFRHKFPQTLPECESFAHVEIRGEIVIKKSTFSELYKPMGYKNERNFCGGVVSRPNDDTFAMEHMDCIMYQTLIKDIDGNISFPKINPVDYLRTIIPTEFVGMIDNSFQLHNIDETPYVFEQMNTNRLEFPYLVDGVVTCFSSSPEMHGKNFKHSIAWKFESEKAESRVLDIEWSIKSNLAFFPTLIIESVELGGTTVSRVSGGSFNNLLNLGAWINSTILVEKSGDIIPHISKVTKPIMHLGLESLTENNLPDYEDLYVDGANLFTKNTSIQKEIKFCKGVLKLDVDGLGPAKVKELWDSGFTSIWELMNLANIWNNLNAFTLHFGNELSDNSLWDKNWDKITPKLYETLTNIKPDLLIRCCELDAVGRSISLEVCKYKYIKDYNSEKYNHKAFQTCLNDAELWNMLDVYETLLDLSDYEVKEVIEGSETLDVCLTGSPKPNWKTKGVFLQEMADKYPMLTLNEVAVGKATILITDDINSTTGKTAKAKKKGTTIKTYEEIFERKF